MRKARALAVGAGAALMVLLPAGSAFAHECFVANRHGAPHGNAWLEINLDEEAAFLVQEGEITPEQAACVTNSLPETIFIKVKGANGSGNVLMGNNPNAEAKGMDGKGIDHLGAYFAACGLAE